MNINVKDEEIFRGGLHSAGKLGSIMRLRGAYITANESACTWNGISTDLVLCSVLFVESRCKDESDHHMDDRPDNCKSFAAVAVALAAVLAFMPAPLIPEVARAAYALTFPNPFSA